MKGLLFFCGLAGLVLGSASPPPTAAAAVGAAAREEPREQAPRERIGAALAKRAAYEEEYAIPAFPPSNVPAGEAAAAATAQPGRAAVATVAPLPPRARRTASRDKGAVPAARPEPPDRPLSREGEPAAAEPPRPGHSRVKVVVSLPQQKAWVFRDGKLFGTSRVSTGKKGHATPAGTFRILQKKVRHRSNRYANAPMPYMQRLTWSGIALHAGHVPGYRASHGCIRLPWSFAKKLYGITDFATEVTVTHARPKTAEAALAIA